MRYQFTPAAERALATAARWSAPESDGASPQALLLGLFLEEECRAARMLADAQISLDSIRSRWPELTPTDMTPDLRTPVARDLDEVIQAALERLAEYPRPIFLATEHLLLGLAAARGEVSQWLKEHGLEADELEIAVHAANGFTTEPLEVDLSPALADPPTRVEIPILQLPREAAAAAPVVNEMAVENAAIARILDAAGNRAREGARVIEDYARFALDDRLLSEQLKQLRHDIRAALDRLPRAERLASRDTLADVGVDVTTESERSRAGASDVLSANFARLAESLRSLEEYGKLLTPDLGATFESLRYRAYTLERVMGLAYESRQRLANAQLYVLLAGGESNLEFEELAQSLVDAGVHAIQLRDKVLPDRRLLERARVLRAITRNTPTLFIMNDRPDLAMLSEADGVHVGQDELTVHDVRRIVGPQMLIGVSTHSIEQARQAVLDGANYLGVGPVFKSVTKEFAEHPGLSFVAQAHREIGLPMFAIGGLNEHNVPEVLAAGAQRIAVSNAVTGAVQPAAAAKRLLKLLADAP